MATSMFDEIRQCHSQQKIPWFECQRARLEEERLERIHGLRPPLEAIVLSMDENGKIHRSMEYVYG